MRHAAVIVMTAVFPALLLAGCGKTPAPEPSPVPTPVVTAAPTATPAPTPRPSPTPSPTAPPPVEYTPGVRTDTDYNNATLGLYFVPDENMVLATEEEMNLMLQSSASMVYGDQPNGDALLDHAMQATTYEMMAVNVLDGSNVLFSNEKLSMEGITESLYLDILTQQLDALDTSLDITYEKLGTVTLGDTDFAGLTYTLSNQGAQASQTVLIKKVADRMCSVSLSYADAAAYDALLECFHPISSL